MKPVSVDAQADCTPVLTSMLQLDWSAAGTMPQQVISDAQLPLPPVPLPVPVPVPVPVPLPVPVPAAHCELQLELSQLPIDVPAVWQAELMLIAQPERHWRSLHWQPEMQLKYEPHAPSAEDSCEPHLPSTHDEQAALFAPVVAVEPWQVGKLPPLLELLLHANTAATNAAESPKTIPFMMHSSVVGSQGS